jgi:hypothetical protein
LWGQAGLGDGNQRVGVFFFDATKLRESGADRQAQQRATTDAGIDDGDGSDTARDYP